MNSSELKVSKLIWEGEDGKSQTATEIRVSEEDELLTAEFNPPLNPGKGKLKMSYTGTLNDKLKGFYRSKYKTSDGVEYYNGVTQFEPTDARKALVCWDEPAIKATFDVTLIVPKDKVALCNMVWYTN